MSRAFVSALAVVALAACSGEEPEQRERKAMDTLIAFARAPNDANWEAVPFADWVDLGLGDSIRARRSAERLREPAAWTLSVDAFRARAGTGSALQLLAGEEGRLRVTFGPHRHCIAPPVPPPAQLADLARIAVQPHDIGSCLEWWSVDVFVDDDGEIRGVTLDVWEP